jgi:selenide,water dikinase
MGPEALAQVLRPLADMFDAARYPNLLRGLEDPDDALVWKLDADARLVHTADFFPPVVDDPYAFGAIAPRTPCPTCTRWAARRCSRINLVGFPDDMDPTILSEILRGGGEKVKEAGARRGRRPYDLGQRTEVRSRRHRPRAPGQNPRKGGARTETFSYSPSR